MAVAKMQQLGPNRAVDLSTVSVAAATQIGIDRFAGGNRGIIMRLDSIDDRSSQSDVRQYQDEANRKSLLTPERRAVLDALEHEFSELLNSLQR